MIIENFITLFFAMLIVALIPGPAILAVVSTSISKNFKSGIYMSAGIVFADYIFIVLTTTGLVYLAQYLGSAFIFIKYLCAIYLMWLGLKLLINLPNKKASTNNSIAIHSNNKYRFDFILGVFITLSNPKAILFYLALFPTFIDMNTVSYVDILIIMLSATLSFGSVNIFYAYLASTSKRFANNQSSPKILNRIAGSVIFTSGLTVAIRN